MEKIKFEDKSKDQMLLILLQEFLSKFGDLEDFDNLEKTFKALRKEQLVTKTIELAGVIVILLNMLSSVVNSFFGTQVMNFDDIGEIIQNSKDMGKEDFDKYVEERIHKAQDKIEEINENDIKRESEKNNAI